MRAGPWSPRVAVALVVLASAAFVYVTAELMPVGALPAIAADLGVGEAVVGTLLGGYALVAAVATVPLVRLTARWPRRRTLLFSLACLTVSQLICAAAPSFAVLAAGRMLSALTHGLMWSVIAPIGARLVPATHAGRATMAVYAGTGLALVVGSPLTAALSELWGWRQAVLAIAVAAAAVLLTARGVLPPMAEGAGHRAGGQWHRNRRLFTMSVLTLVGVTGHFISYTFIAVIARDIVGVSGPNLAWLLAGYGIAGLSAMALLARPGDRRPRLAIVGALTGLLLVFAALAGLGFAERAGFAAGAAALAVGVTAVLAWGATATAVPPMLQAAVIRQAPEDPDGASGVYVTAFQIGIMAGSLAGGLIYQRAGVEVMLAASGLLIAGALAAVVASRDLFGSNAERDSTDIHRA